MFNHFRQRLHENPLHQSSLKQREADGRARRVHGGHQAPEIHRRHRQKHSVAAVNMAIPKLSGRLQLDDECVVLKGALTFWRNELFLVQCYSIE